MYKVDIVILLSPSNVLPLNRSRDPCVGRLLSTADCKMKLSSCRLEKLHGRDRKHASRSVAMRSDRRWSGATAVDKEESKNIDTGRSDGVKEENLSWAFNRWEKCNKEILLASSGDVVLRPNFCLISWTNPDVKKCQIFNLFS